MKSLYGAGPVPRRGWSVLVPILVLACSKSPVEPRFPALEIVPAGGDGQYGTAGLELPQPLRIVVRAADSKLPVEDVDVLWEVVSGDATLLGPDVRVTDEAGAAEVSLRLGVSEGEIMISATVAGQSGATAVLHAFLVGTPALTSVEPTAVAAGESVSLEGENFSPVPDQNVVLFSGIRGRVTSATATRLVVDVPECLAPRGSVSVRTSLGTVSSDSIEVSVVSGGPVLSMAVGQHVDLDDPMALHCVRLSGEAGAAFMAMPYSSSTVAAALHPFQMTGLVHAPVLTAPARAGERSFADLTGSGVGSPGSEIPSAQERFEAGLRLEEGTLIEQRERGHHLLSEALPAPAAAPPVVGQTRDFFVYNGETDPSIRFDEITATVRHVGTHVAVYVDNDAPEPGFTDADLQALAARFDQVIHPAVTDAFGHPSDLDGTSRIAVLFTPVVNGLTPREATSFVGGFFFGRDLMPELSSSNGAEVFYALVPDPDALYSDRRDRQQVLQVVPGILAHEFQHMVHYNQRVLLRDGSQDALWMLEGLAQMAEELVARAYEEEAPLEAELFRDGNRRRARLFLERPDTVSLVVSSGRGTLGERGAGLLFLLYLHQQHGDDLLGRLTRSTRTGVANVEAEVGADWSAVLPDWATAMFLDGSAAESDRFSYPGFDLWAFLEDPPPFRVQPHGGSDFERSGSLPSSSLRYFILRPPDGGSLSITIGGAGGGSHGPGAAFGLRIVRIE